MNRLFIENLFRGVLLLLLQIYIFNNVGLLGYLNPYVYVLFILLLPLETPPSVLLIASFAMGFGVDYFLNTMGINTAACVFIAYLRPKLIKLLNPKIELDQGIKIGIRDFGFTWFLTYTSVLVVIHHIILFFLEVFRFDELFDTLKRSLLSAAFSIIIIILSQYIFYRPKKNK